MALAAAAARALLTVLLTWRSAGSADLATQCAEELSSVYEAVAERKVSFFHFNPGFSCSVVPSMFQSCLLRCGYLPLHCS